MKGLACVLDLQVQTGITEPQRIPREERSAIRLETVVWGGVMMTQITMEVKPESQRKEPPALEDSFGLSFVDSGQLLKLMKREVP